MPRTTELIPRALTVAPIFAAALPLIVVVFNELRSAHTVSSTCCDWAVLTIQSRDAAHGALLVGPYSQYHWNHPGPFFAYWSVPFLDLAHGNFGGLGIASALGNLLCVTLIVILAGRLGRDRMSNTIGRCAAAAALLGFQTVFGLDLLRDPWNPLTIVLPVALFIVSCVAYVHGRRWAVVVAALSGSFALQTHVGTIPVVVATAMATLVLMWHSRRVEPHRGRLPIAVAAGATAIAWAPPIWQQTMRSDGNLSEITHYFLRGGPTSHPNLSEAIRVVFLQIGLMSRQLDLIVGPAQHKAPPLSVTQFVVPVVLAAVLVVGIVRSGESERRWIRSLCVCVLTAMAATVIAALRAATPLPAYVVSSALSVGILLWATAAVVVADTLRRVANMNRTSVPESSIAARDDEQPRRELPTRAKALASSLAVVVLLGAAVPVTAKAIALRPLNRARAYPDIATLSDATWRVVSERRNRSVLIEVGGSTTAPPWDAVAGIANDLQRRGARIEVPPDWDYVFGVDHADHGDFRTHVLVVGKDPDAATRHVIASPGVRLLAATPADSVYLLPSEASRSAH